MKPSLFKLSLILGLFLMYSACAQAQFGVRIKYNSQNFVDWSNAAEKRISFGGRGFDLYSNGYELGIDYWFRLPKKRIEFLPEVSYTLANTTVDHPIFEKFTYKAINLNFHTQIYALDLEGDCNCPTFSKQGPSINKGLFLHVTPGLSYYNADVTLNPISSMALNNADGLLFRVGVGLGMDVGISDFFTITPMVSYYFSSAATWENLAINTNDPDFMVLDAVTNPTILQFTLRLGFRPDYKKRRF